VTMGSLLSPMANPSTFTVDFGKRSLRLRLAVRER
jgi:hypothetical protein